MVDLGETNTNTTLSTTAGAAPSPQSTSVGAVSGAVPPQPDTTSHTPNHPTKGRQTIPFHVIFSSNLDLIIPPLISRRTVILSPLVSCNLRNEISRFISHRTTVTSSHLTQVFDIFRLVSYEGPRSGLILFHLV